VRGLCKIGSGRSLNVVDPQEIVYGNRTELISLVLDQQSAEHGIMLSFFETGQSLEIVRMETFNA
jgi:hypothetical protein